MTDLPVWRIALNDSSHPMYSIAWDVFGRRFNVDRTAKKYEDRRDEILPFLYAILDSEDLYMENALGEGYAPIHAVDLLGEWQVLEAIPRLLAYVDDENDEDDDIIVNGRAALALEKMPPEAIDQLLEYGQRDDKRAMSAMFMLTYVGHGDERCFDFICSVFERMKTEYDIITVAECLADNNLEKAEVYLLEKSKQGRFRRFKSDFKGIIEAARRDDWR